MTKSDYKKLEHGHSPHEIQKRLATTNRSFLKDFVYGGIDGAVTTFAIVAGVIGAALETKTVIILGISNILADGFSMAASNYLGTKTELEERRLIERFEEQQIRDFPEGEKEEIRQIFINKGIQGDVLETVVNQVTADRREWLKLMLVEEYGIGHSEPVPWKAGAMTFLSFTLFGLIPLMPFLFGMEKSFSLSATATGIAFFSIGIVKSRWTRVSPLKSGMETLAIGASAAVLAYFAGSVVSGL